MKEIIVTTQAEWDALPARFEEYTRIIIKDTKGYWIRVVARGNSSVEARGNSSVEAREQQRRGLGEQQRRGLGEQRS